MSAIKASPVVSGDTKMTTTAINQRAISAELRGMTAAVIQK